MHISNINIYSLSFVLNGQNKFPKHLNHQNGWDNDLQKDQA
jgi:hypothetical protein